MRARALLLAVALAALCAQVAHGDAADETPPSLPVPVYGSYGWPLQGPVMRAFEPPTGPYGAGHRGIDISGSAGASVRAAEAGVVAFAGRVAGELHVSIDHPDGVRTSYAFLSAIEVKAGAPIARGAVLGAVGSGHPGVGSPHLHFGARYAGQYIDPMLLLERGSLVGLIHLAPIEKGSEEGPVG